MAVAVEAFEQSEAPSASEWNAALDRIDVYPSKDGYTATVVRNGGLREGTDAVAAICNRRGEVKHWRDLDNLVAYVLRNVSKQPSIFVHTGASKCA